MIIVKNPGISLVNARSGIKIKSKIKIKIKNGNLRPLADRVASGDCSPEAPTDPDVPALEHPVPRTSCYYVLPGW